jgi:hypothetical protein
MLLFRFGQCPVVGGGWGLGARGWGLERYPHFLGLLRSFRGLLCIFMQDWAELCIGCGDLAVGGLGQTKPIILIIKDLFARRAGLGVSGVWWLVHVRPTVPGFSEGGI